MTPLRFHEDAEARRWLAAGSLRVPLVALKFGSPVLVIATLAVIIRQHDLAAQPLGLLIALAFPFAVPFLLAGAYPLLRWMPQEWTIDAAGIRGRGRVSGHCRWSEIAWWGSTPVDRLPAHVCFVFRRRPTYRHFGEKMLVPASCRNQVEVWFSHTATAERRAITVPQ